MAIIFSTVHDLSSIILSTFLLSIIGRKTFSGVSFTAKSFPDTTYSSYVYKAVSETSARVFHIQTCQPLIKENLETHEKKSGDSTKNSEILFFSRSRLNKPLFHRRKSLTVYLNVTLLYLCSLL